MKTRILAITILFLFILTGVRLAWIYAGWQHERPVAAGGVLDLSGAAWGEPIRLDGQWLFYPEQYLYAGNTGTPRGPGIPLDLPGPWLGEFEGAGEAVGYGSYRLLLKLNEPAGRELALAIPSVLTASAVYVDGVRAGGAGKPGTDAESTVPSDQPYIVAFTASQNEVELVLHVANFSNPMQGGLGGSIKLGTESAIAGAKQFSIAMQLLVVVVLLIHVLYAAVLLVQNVCAPYAEIAESQDKRLWLSLKSGTKLNADPGRLHQLLVILLDNALKYTEANDSIGITTFMEDHRLVIEVSDTGIGISESGAAHVFDRFYREDEARTRESGGAGLGLAIALWIVTGHQGSIKAIPNERRGTTFRVKLPR